MHVKVIPPGSYKFDVPQVELIKVAKDGLRGHDFKEFVKRAGWQVADMARHLDTKPGDVPIHGIALGATEFYGPNRNGDGFKIATCRKCHDSFVKHARWYRNHQNKDPRKSYGVVKQSEFNEDMKRIELIAYLNGTKEAADRNGGLVADEELAMLNSGKDIPTSMACKVAYDICACCGNRAKNKGEYCTGEDEGGHCKRGGVRNRMCFMHDDGFMNHVENPDAGFFDWSKVYKGADRTSWADGLLKAASGLTLGGAELAEKLGVTLPQYMLFDAPDAWPTRTEKLASKLAKLEQEFSSGASKPYDMGLLALDVPSVTTDTPKEVLAALAMYKVALPVEPWLKLVHGDVTWTNADMIKRALPGIYSRMLVDGSIKEASHLLPVMRTKVGLSALNWALDNMSSYSLDQAMVETRIKRAALRGYSQPTVLKEAMVKTAGMEETLARGYALYKLAVLQTLENNDDSFDLTCEYAVRQHYV